MVNEDQGCCERESNRARPILRSAPSLIHINVLERGGIQLRLSRSTNCLSDVLEPSKNNFNLVRLLATLGVVWGHQALHFGTQSHRDYLSDFLGIEYEGSLGVYAFFLLSGILISKSYLSNPSTISFLALRVARIWPAAAICSTGYLLIVGPLMSGRNRLLFLTEPATWSCLAQNVTIVGGTCWTHPMAFLHAQVPVSWNNPLWTLPLEVHCYLLVLLLGAVGILRRPAQTSAVCAIIVVGFLWIAQYPPINTFIYTDFARMGGYSFYPIPFFLLGMIIFANRKWILLDYRIAWGLVALYVFNAHNRLGHVLLYPALVYGVLVFGASPLIQAIWSPRNDYSYGIYIYGFAVGQFVSHRFQGIDGLLGLGVVYAVTIPIAALSWHLVERPALRFAHRLVRGRPSLDVRVRAAFAAQRLPALASATALIALSSVWYLHNRQDRSRRLSSLDQVAEVPPALIRSLEGLFAHAPTRFSIHTSGATTLSVKFGIRDGAWREGTTNGVCFGVLQGDRVFWRRCLDPKAVSGDRGEQSDVIHLPGGVPDVTLETSCRLDCAYAWSYWSAAILDGA